MIERYVTLVDRHPRYLTPGLVRRICDGRVVQRFQCKRCKRTFSTQTFRVDRGLRRPSIDFPIFLGLVSKVSQRQLTRKYHCGRDAIARRLERYGKHCRAFHESALSRRGSSTPWDGQFQLDELETYETDRRLKPVTVPLLVQLPSRCILHAAVARFRPENRSVRESRSSSSGSRRKKDTNAAVNRARKSASASPC